MNNAEIENSRISIEYLNEPIETSLHRIRGSKDREQECKEIEKKLKRQEIILKAYEDLQLLEFAQKSGMNHEVYDWAVFNLVKWILSGNQYEQGTLPNEQIEDFFKSKSSGDANGDQTINERKRWINLGS